MSISWDINRRNEREQNHGHSQNTMPLQPFQREREKDPQQPRDYFDNKVGCFVNNLTKIFFIFSTTKKELCVLSLVPNSKKIVKSIVIPIVQE